MDILDDADAVHYRAVTQILLANAGVDGLVVLLTPQAMTDPPARAEAVIVAARESPKPVLACWRAAELVRRGRERFAAASIPPFVARRPRVEAFGYLACYRCHQKALLQAPGPSSRHKEPHVEGACLIVERALGARRRTPKSAEATAVLRAFPISTSPSIDANSAAEPLAAAAGVGLPVAMKINSPDISPKSDVGGVRLNIREPRSLRTTFREMMNAVTAQSPDAQLDGVTIEPLPERPQACEIMMGIASDPVFGPVISVGAGGPLSRSSPTATSPCRR